MEKEQFLILIDKYINGQATENEKLLVEAYYSRLIGVQEVEVDEIANEKQLKEVLFKQINKQIESESKENPAIGLKANKNIALWWLSTAALLLVVFSIGIMLYKAHKKNLGTTTAYASQIEPGVNKAVLTLANGEKVILDSVSNGEIAEQNGVKIKREKSGLLEYIHIDRISNEPAKMAFNTVETPRGGQYKIVLDDGTIVWLNAASSLRYPLQFNGAERKVMLTGEGYFEVAHNKAKPFIVVTNKQEVEVLGTHFNISAYTDEEEIKTTLLEGSVKVVARPDQKETLQQYLKPGEQFVLNNSNWSVKTVDAATQVAWKNGRFIFKDEALKSVMRKLARWYDIEVDYANSIENLSFSGKISRSKTLQEVLKILTRTNDVTFKVQGRRVTVMP